MEFSPELLKGNRVTLLLTILARHADLYGYDIAQRLSDATEGRISPGQSTLYPALHQMEAHGPVDAYWTEAGGRKREYSTLTPTGRQELGRRQREWREFQRTLNAVLDTPEECWSN